MSDTQIHAGQVWRHRETGDTVTVHAVDEVGLAPVCLDAEGIWRVGADYLLDAYELVEGVADVRGLG